MAKKETSSSSKSKITFGKKAKNGKAKKKYGPKEERPKKYNRQGR
jgi:hypothetical protein